MAAIDEVYRRIKRRSMVNGETSQREDAPMAPSPAEPVYDSPGVQQITDQRRIREARIARSAALRTRIPDDPGSFAARASAIGAANDQIETIQGRSAPVQNVQSVGEIRNARANLSGQAVREIERQQNERINMLRQQGIDPSADPELQRLAAARTKWGMAGTANSATEGPQLASSLTDAEGVQVGQRRLAERQMAKRGAYEELYGQMVQPEAIARGEGAAETDAARQRAAIARQTALQNANNAMSGSRAEGELIPQSPETAGIVQGRMAANAAQIAADKARAAEGGLAEATATAASEPMAMEADRRRRIAESRLANATTNRASSYASIGILSPEAQQEFNARVGDQAAKIGSVISGMFTSAGGVAGDASELLADYENQVVNRIEAMASTDPQEAANLASTAIRALPPPTETGDYQQVAGWRGVNRRKAATAMKLTGIRQRLMKIAAMTASTAQ